MSKPSQSRSDLLRSAGIVAASLPFLKSADGQTPRPQVKALPIEFGSEKMVFCDWWFIEAGYGLAFTAE